MQPRTLESDYMTMCQGFTAQIAELATRWPAAQGFWTLWCKEHRHVAHSIVSRDASYWHSAEADPQWTGFMKLRRRMVSALGQGLIASGGSEAVRQSLRQLLADHDRGFMKLLQIEMEQVKHQLKAAFAVKKTVSAYAQTAQFRGE